MPVSKERVGLVQRLRRLARKHNVNAVKDNAAKQVVLEMIGNLREVVGMLPEDKVETEGGREGGRQGVREEGRGGVKHVRT